LFDLKTNGKPSMNAKVLLDLVLEFYKEYETSIDFQTIFDTNDQHQCKLIDQDFLESIVKEKFANICAPNKTINKAIFFAFMSPLIRQLFEREFNKRDLFGKFNIRIDMKKSSIKDLSFLYQNF